MIRPTVARIDLNALQSNFRRLAEYLANEPREGPPRVIAVVKANAYGLGAGPVGRALEAAGADLIACADIEEGAALRGPSPRGRPPRYPCTAGMNTRPCHSAFPR